MGRAGRLSDYVGFEGCWLPGWRALWLPPGLKAEMVKRSLSGGDLEIGGSRGTRVGL